MRKAALPHQMHDLPTGVKQKPAMLDSGTSLVYSFSFQTATKQEVEEEASAHVQVFTTPPSSERLLLRKERTFDHSKSCNLSNLTGFCSRTHSKDENQ